MTDELFTFINYFFEDIEDATTFMKSQYGDVNFLHAKNLGKIPKFLDNIKNSPIKRFAFHGRGATFTKKKYSFNVEFDFSTKKIGFSEWNLFTYMKNRSIERITLEDSKAVINLLLDAGKIEGEEDCYVLSNKN